MSVRDGKRETSGVCSLGIDPQSAVDMYRTMARIRAFEETTEKLFLGGEIPGFVHLSIGQEAVAAGVCAALRAEDYITTTHRGHGHTLAKGADPSRMMAELFGRLEGVCKGRGGSMHIADFSVGVLGANGVVPGGIGIATGAALAQRIIGSDRVAVTFFGDGGTARGLFHESLNLASIWNLPVVFVCENNGWASTTRSDEGLAVESVADRASAYAMNGVSVDGNDVFSLHEAVRVAVEAARNGKGPTLLEARTSRMKGHFVGDPMSYRDKADLEKWAEHDPLVFAASRLLEEGILQDSLRKQIHAEAEAEISSAVDYARSGSEPDRRDVAAFLYSEQVQ